MVMLPTDLPNIANYQVLELIDESDRSLIYRARNGNNGQSVIIKLMRHEYPSFKELVQFRNQYAIMRRIADANAKNLEIEGIVKPYALERYKNRYALIMEDVGGVALSVTSHQRCDPASAKDASGQTPRRRKTQGNADQERERASKPVTSHSIVKFLDIAIQLAEILHQLHQNHIIHKDIKPANILIHPKTQQIKLIDFSISTILPKEPQTLQTPNILEGTLAYLSPEQTGRMNRGIDYRSDFYSLGVTFYELLTGELPFTTDDPLELVHCHIAKIPPAPLNKGGGGNRRDRTPEILADIVMKLMAKNAEDRYQSALGLKYDLEKCRSQWQTNQTIEPFVLGERDWCDRFIIPEKLYGREKEVQALLDAFERVAAPLGWESPPALLRKGGEERKAEMMLVAGYSGIGKTAVINEVHKPITRQHGYFIKGKFDQFNRNIPFSAFLQAFRSLMRQLLGESDSSLARWKAKILGVLGESGQVLIEVIPELERIIGSQPPIPELSGSAAQNRFNLLFGKFIRAIATPEHPLVIFLDDLQWVDSASLHLLKLLMEDKSGYLLVLGAYRDNEVFPAHPLMLTLEEIRQQKATVNTLTLEPLKEEDINCLVADSLHCSVEIAKPLSQLVDQKTRGNPFFATQFLQELQVDGWISFIPITPLIKGGRGGSTSLRQGGYWQCDLTRVRQLALTDDVVAFMVGRLRKLPEETQNVLKIAACMGNQFDLATLAAICEQDREEVAVNLWRSLQVGLVIPEDETYKFFQGEEQEIETVDEITVDYRFLHDRVQQAAYCLIGDDRKQNVHLQIGRILLHKTPDRQQEEKRFLIVNQLNIGANLIQDRDERDRLAHLNLLAGRKAKIATAYANAMDYFSRGYQLLSKDCWQVNYPQALALSEAAAEAAYLNGNFVEMDRWIDLALNNSNYFLDTIAIYNIKIQSLTAQNKLKEAVVKSLEVLNKLNIELDENTTKIDLEKAIKTSSKNLQDRAIEAAIDLPKMTDPHRLAAMQILSTAIAPAYVGESDLLPMLVIKQVELSLEFGNTELSAYAYVMYGLILCGVLGDIKLGYQFGLLADRLLDKLNAKQLECRVLNIFNAFIRHWQAPLQDTLPALQKGYRVGLERGEVEFLGYCALNYSINSMWSGRELLSTERKIADFVQAIGRFNQQTTRTYLQIYWQIALSLLAEEKPKDVDGKAYQASAMLPVHQNAHDAYALATRSLAKLFIHYLFGDFAEAIAAADTGRAYIESLIGNAAVPIFPFYESLARLAICDRLQPSEQDTTLETVAANQKKMKDWSEHAPVNYLSKFHLVEAERHRVLGHKTEAIESYDAAILAAKTNAYIQEEALANELAAKFYLDWGFDDPRAKGKEKIAAVYMQEAYYCYSRWGAKAKIIDLEIRYPQLLRPILQPSEESSETLKALTSVAAPKISVHSSNSSSFNHSLNQTFDFSSILKASQALAEIVELDELLCRLTQIILQNSGGDRCALILPDEKENWQVEAIATAENVELCRVSLAGHAHLPVKLIQYVKNVREILAIDKGETDLPVSDPYLLQQQPQSLLCLPLLHQGQLVGILYVSNHSTAGIFSRDRILVLNFLCTQAAISLENARLYRDLERRVEERTAALQQSQYELTDYIENAAISLHWVDKNGIIIWANQTELEFLGYEREEYIGQPIAKFHADPEVIADILARLANDETLVNYEARLRCKDGSIRYVQINSNVFYRDGKFIHTRCFTTDVTERKLVEREWRGSQQRYATLVDMLPTGIFLTDPQGNSRYNNPSCCKMLGLTPAEVSGEGWAKTLHPDDRERVFQGWYRAAQNQQMPYQTDCRFLHRDGKVVWLSVQAVEEFDLEGNLTGYIGSLTDISDRKAAEAALNKLVEGTSATTGEDFFPALVRHISTALDVPIALITQFVGEELQSIAFMVDGELQPNFTYNLPETPCVELVTEYSYHCPCGLSDRFPNNPHRKRGVESYLGIALRDRQGQVLGSLCIFDRQPLQEPERARQILEIFASRTAAEMQRQRIEIALHNLIAGTAVTDGTNFFPLLARHLTEALGVSHALIAERVGDKEVTLAYYGDGQHIPCQSLSLLGTPCEEVYDRGAYYCELKPCQTCSELSKMEAKSYLGVALYDLQGNAIGLLCIFHRQFLSDPTHAEQILRVFAARAATELERQRAETALQNLIAGTATLTGPDFFPGLVRYIAEALNASHAFVTEVVEGDRLHFLAAWGDGEYLPNDTIDAEGTTCEIALRQGAYHCDRDVVACFPQNPRLAVMGVESYMGIALQNRQGHKIGTLCIFAREPLLDSERSEQILRVFAARAAAELERQGAQAALEQLNRELERRVEERTRELVRSEQDLRTIFNNVYDGIFIHNLDGSILDVNNRALELFGATRGQILATTIAALSAIDSPLDNLVELFGQASDGAKLQFEWKHQRLSDRSIFNSEISLRKVTLGNRSAIVAGVRDISDRKRAENALQEERLRLELALDAAQMGTWSCTLQTGQLIWSDRAQEIFGFEPGTFPGDRDTFIAMIYPDDRDRVLAAITATFETGAPYHVEYRIHRRDGEIRWIAVWGRIREASPEELETSSGSHRLSSPDSQLVGVVVDISDRKAAEEKLRASERRYATLAAAAPVGIFRTDAVGYCLYVNDRWCQIAGLTPEEAAGDGWRQGLHPDDRDRIATEWYESVQENRLIQLECRFQRPDGAVSWVYAQSVAERDATGRVFGYVGTVVDITERKQAEEQLKTLSERLELALEGAKIGIWEWNAASDRLIWDDRMFSLYGVAPDDFSGRYEDWRERVHPDDLMQMRQKEEPLLRKRGFADTEYRIVRPNGEVRFIYSSAIAQNDEGGNLTRMIGLNVDITERKAIELALQTSESRYASLAAAVPVGIFRTDADGYCTYVNDRWCQMAGLAPDTAAREGWQQALHPDDRELIAAEWKHAARKNCPFQLEYRFQRPDGTITWVYGQAVAEGDADGQIVGYVGTLTDISDRKKAELALQDAQVQFRRMTENIPGTIYRYISRADGSDEYTYVSSRIREMFELEPEAVLQNAACLRGRIHADDTARIDPAMGVFAETLQPFASEYRLLLPQKGLRWVQAIARPERLANGDTIWDGVVLDISDRKKSEQQLRGLSERLELAMLSAQIGIWEYDYQNDILSWDEVMFAIYGVRSEDFGDTLKDWEQCVHPEDLAEAKQVAENGGPRLTHEYRIVRPDGTIRHIFATALIERDEGKQLTRAIGTNIDISDRKAAEAQLQRTNQELARATRLKDEFLANMSHELRTPLTAILGMTEGLQEEVFGPTNAMQLKALKTIEQSGSHLLELIDDILDLSKIESGRVELEYSSVAVKSLCQSSLVFVKQQSQKKGIQLHLNVPANLPDITVDERRMRQVLINLLNNAVKFTSEGGRIVLEVLPFQSNETHAQNTLRFTVTDTGIGIAPENLQKLFQPFVQIDSSLNRQYEGTGLGLALVKQIVELHGGWATVTSKVGAGSCFAIELPYSPSVLSLSPLLNAASEPNALAPLQLPIAPLILLAEDNEANIGTLSSYLQAKGYRLQVARDGRAAIDLARDEAPNLILMDIQMPGMDGLSVIQRIRQDTNLAQIPIIALTALTMEGDRERCLAAGANLYLSKPVKLKQLVLSMQKLLTNEAITV